MQAVACPLAALEEARRLLLAPSFQPKHIGRYASMMVEATQELTRNFQSGEVRNVQPDMMELTLDIVVRTPFGTSVVRSSTTSFGKGARPR